MPLVEGIQVAPVPKIEPKWPWVLLLTFVFFEYTRPFDVYLRALSVLHLPGIVSVFMFTIFLRNKKAYLRTESLYRWLLVFWLLIAVSTLYSPNSRAAYNLTVGTWWHMVGCVFPLAVLVTSKERLLAFFWFWLTTQVALSLFVITHGGHGPGGFLWDENDAALAIDMAMPYAVYMTQIPGLPKWKKTLLMAALLVMIAAVVVTGSRGGVLGMAGMIIAATIVSERPVRNGLIVATVVAAVLVVLVRVLPSDYVDDMRTIDDPTESTADERLWSWSVGWEMFKANPLVGVGAGNYPWTNNLYAERSSMYHPGRRILGGRMAHSIYFTVLSELGTIGTLVFIAILTTMFRRYRDLRRMLRGRGPPSDNARTFLILFKAHCASCAAFLTAGAFLSVLYYPPFWYLVGVTAVTYAVAKLTLDGEPAGVSAVKKALVSPSITRGRKVND